MIIIKTTISKSVPFMFNVLIKCPIVKDFVNESWNSCLLSSHWTFENPIKWKLEIIKGSFIYFSRLFLWFQQFWQWGHVNFPLKKCGKSSKTVFISEQRKAFLIVNKESGSAIVTNEWRSFLGETFQLTKLALHETVYTPQSVRVVTIINPRLNLIILS